MIPRFPLRTSDTIDRLPKMSSKSRWRKPASTMMALRISCGRKRGSLMEHEVTLAPGIPSTEKMPTLMGRERDTLNSARQPLYNTLSFGIAFSTSSRENCQN